VQTENLRGYPQDIHSRGITKALALQVLLCLRVLRCDVVLSCGVYVNLFRVWCAKRSYVIHCRACNERCVVAPYRLSVWALCDVCVRVAHGVSRQRNAAVLCSNTSKCEAFVILLLVHVLLLCCVCV
jgi:hypothetical protein